MKSLYLKTVFKYIILHKIINLGNKKTNFISMYLSNENEWMNESALPYRDFKAILNMSLLHALILLQNIFHCWCILKSNFTKGKNWRNDYFKPKNLRIFYQIKKIILTNEPTLSKKSCKKSIYLNVFPRNRSASSSKIQLFDISKEAAMAAITITLLLRSKNV